MSEVLVERLRHAVDPYGDLGAGGEDEATLLWRVGQMRDQIDAAHHQLDMLDAPRERGGERLSLAGRLAALRG